MRRGLVLAGGGVAGIAWELGVLRGLDDAVPGLAGELAGADVVVGTSAGSTVAAQITSGTPIDALFRAQLRGTSEEIEVDVDITELAGRFASAAEGASDGADLRRRVGALALATPTVTEPVRWAAVAARLPVPTWPAGRLLIPAVDAESGEVAVFDRGSGVDLTDAVTASCAVPGVWPPVTIGGRRYIDGGVRSGTNADLATGCDLVLVVTPTPPGAAQLWGSLDDEIAALAPAEVEVIRGNDASVAAFGTNPLSPATRGPSARAGRVVGTAAGRAVASFWRR